MLDDRDRNARYNEAICACIADFKRDNGRAPRVLDVGVGTGFLSTCCLLGGAEHVTAVDVQLRLEPLPPTGRMPIPSPWAAAQVNATMVRVATTNLGKVAGSKDRFNVVWVEHRNRSPFDKDERFDMIVSEILGTLAMSENMCKCDRALATPVAPRPCRSACSSSPPRCPVAPRGRFLSLYAQHLETFGDESRVYMVGAAPAHLACPRDVAAACALPSVRAGTSPAPRRGAGAVRGAPVPEHARLRPR